MKKIILAITTIFALNLSALDLFKVLEDSYQGKGIEQEVIDGLIEYNASIELLRIVNNI